jgi:hypothetical protein
MLVIHDAKLCNSELFFFRKNWFIFLKKVFSKLFYKKILFFIILKLTVTPFLSNIFYIYVLEIFVYLFFTCCIYKFTCVFTRTLIQFSLKFYKPILIYSGTLKVNSKILIFFQRFIMGFEYKLFFTLCNLKQLWT